MLSSSFCSFFSFISTQHFEREEYGGCLRLKNMRQRKSVFHKMLLQKLSRAEMAAKSWLPLFALHLLLFKVNNAHDGDACAMRPDKQHFLQRKPPAKLFVSPNPICTRSLMMRVSSLTRLEGRYFKFIAPIKGGFH
jgi:hypothetical protein